MKDEVKRVLLEMEKNGWITIAKDLNRDAMAAVFCDDVFKGMTVRKFIEHFYPKDL